MVGPVEQYDLILMEPADFGLASETNTVLRYLELLYGSLLKQEGELIVGGMISSWQRLDTLRQLLSRLPSSMYDYRIIPTSAGQDSNSDDWDDLFYANFSLAFRKIRPSLPDLTSC
jgi:hypothetical protein